MNSFHDPTKVRIAAAPSAGPDSGRMTERFRRPNYGTLEIDVTIADSAAYKEPFTVRVNQRLFADAELIEFICNENEKSIRHYDP